MPPSHASSLPEHSTWWRHGCRARAAGRGLASQGVQGARLGRGLHHHGARRAQVGLPGGRHDLKDAACNNTGAGGSVAAACPHLPGHALPNAQTQATHRKSKPKFRPNAATEIRYLEQNESPPSTVNEAARHKAGGPAP